MRLLNSRTFEFRTFYQDAPPYAILSHRWGKEGEELTFQDLQVGTGVEKQGYAKMLACCARAVKDGYDYVWMDTCCIDKTNNVELQSAINSMFSWYKKSEVCYALLSDCDADNYLHDVAHSEYFTRGWTLQELIAPRELVFFDRNWFPLGSKTILKDLISNITAISPEVLTGQDLESSSVAQRMSWASLRKTTRPEDIAYCLTGLFGVTMPMMYGEGMEQAFVRLQEAILAVSDDQSLFAWKLEEGTGSYGLLAPAPDAFRQSGSFVPMRDLARGTQTTYGMTNLGLRIKLPIAHSTQGDRHILALYCKSLNTDRQIGLHLAPLPDGRFVRSEPYRLVSGYTPLGCWKGYEPFSKESIYIARQFHSPGPPPS
jgi:hypothetical protein